MTKKGGINIKNITIILVGLVSSFAFSINVLAASTALSVDKTNVNINEKFTVTVNMTSAAAWNIHVVANGPVTGCSINEADATTDALDTNKTFTTTCTATGEGTINITMSGDITSASDGNAVEVTGSKIVKVNIPVSELPEDEKDAETNAPINNGSTNKPTENPKTGTISIGAFIVICIIAGIALYLTNKKNKVHKI